VPGATFRVFELPSALPRFYLAERSLAASSDEEAARIMASAEFIPGRDIVTERASGAASAAPGGCGTIAPTLDSNGEVALEVEARCTGFLVDTDQWFHAWTATVDGAATPVERANINQRAVAISPGHHTVRFALAWRAYELGKWITFGSAALLLAWWLGAVLTRRRPARPRPAAS
jgi:hypothetical protein